MTKEQKIAKDYEVALHSAKVLRDGKPEWMSTEDWEQCVKANKEHIKYMLEQDFWTTQNLNILRDAIE